MPATPYKAKILQGAHAYSAPFGVDWGLAEVGLIVDIGSVWLGHVRVDYPVWNNGKPYWLKENFTEVYTTPEPPVDEYILHVKDGIARKFVPE